MTEAVSVVEKEREALKNGLARVELEKQLAETALRDKYETQLRDRDDAIERLRDMKLKLSTKMIGETLEQHCATEFDRIRATAFPRAYFEKDNDARTGSKGDFVFRDMDDTGAEIVSIMFEMKNENDETATKKRNEDFSKSSTRIAPPRAANMRCWFRCLNPRVNFTIPVLSTSRTAIQKCMWSGHNFSCQSSRFCAMRR